MASRGFHRDSTAFELNNSINHGKYLRSNFFDGLRKTIFPQECVWAVQGHSRSLILVPIESACATSYYSVIVTLVLSCIVSEILQVFWITPPLFPPNFGGVPVAPDRLCWDQPVHKPSANQSWNYFRSIPTHVIMVLERHRQTDRRTDGQTDDILWHNRALRSIVL